MHVYMAGCQTKIINNKCVKLKVEQIQVQNVIIPKQIKIRSTSRLRVLKLNKRLNLLKHYIV